MEGTDIVPRRCPCMQCPHVASRHRHLTCRSAVRCEGLTICASHARIHTSSFHLRHLPLPPSIPFEAPLPSDDLLYNPRLSAFVVAMESARKENTLVSSGGEVPSSLRTTVAPNARGEPSIGPPAGEVGDPGLRAAPMTADSVWDWCCSPVGAGSAHCAEIGQGKRGTG